ncbi:unnamed protein product [Camellia sinensis]
MNLSHAYHHSHLPLSSVSVDYPITPTPDAPPLTSSYNDRIRPLLDEKVAEEGIQLPTIVVGDQSAGKSGVLESLSEISLPHGQGICTRVPLIMRLQHHPNAQPDLYLEFHGKTVPTDETRAAEAIKVATDKIAGNGKGISHTPLTLVVKKKGVPDLTMVTFLESLECLFMANLKISMSRFQVDFPTCESIRMSQQKVTADDVNIGLGYVCARNRIGDESYEDARVEEARLFQSHPLLSKIEKSMVGVPVLARKLVQIQATILSNCLPDIVRKINDKLNLNISELIKMPQNLSSVAEAMTVFMRIIGLSKESLRKFFLRGEFDEYPDEKNMHCIARLAEMLNEYSEELQKSAVNKPTENFLMDEIWVLDERKGTGLPNFLPRTSFLIILQRKVKEIANTPVDFMAKVWNYIESVVISVLLYHCDSYPQLLSSTRRAAHDLIAKMKEKSFDRVMKIIEMEKLTDYTCSPEYMTEWAKFMAHQNAFTEVMNDNFKPSQVTIKGFGEIEVGHLHFHSSTTEQAFDMKMRITAYWKIILKRLVDSLALHLLSINELVNRNMEIEIVNELMGSHGGGIERMLEESPPVALKRERHTQQEY